MAICIKELEESCTLQRYGATPLCHHVVAYEEGSKHFQDMLSHFSNSLVRIEHPATLHLSKHLSRLERM